MKNTKQCSMLFLILFFLSACSANQPKEIKEEANTGRETLSQKAIKEDLTYLDEFLQKSSSYQGLNGFDYQKAFANFQDNLPHSGTTSADFGIFLAETIGQLGDRHAYVKGYDLPNSKFLPFVVAPLTDKVVGLKYDKSTKTYAFLYPNHPYLTAINNTPIDEFLQKIELRGKLAPKKSFFSRAVKRLKYMEKNYALMKEPLPDTFTFTFSNEAGRDTVINQALENSRKKHFTWNEKFDLKYGHIREDEAFNDEEIAKQLFSIKKGNVGYIHLPSMLYEEDAPIIYKGLNDFMNEQTTKATNAMIVDVRSNGGGVRGLIWELAGYFTHPDSIYVVNVAQQRAELPLNEDWKADLHNRFLYAFETLDKEEQITVTRFLETFQPMYDLPKDKFSPFYYALFNGKKLGKNKYHYNKPIYILTNERSFSAASILVTTFKGLPNVQVMGVNTDGSSGNSERLELPNSGLKCKIRTMVSFQKDGKILDGFGTAPDRLIERNIDHLLWKTDNQLEEVLEISTKIK
ncbi:MAG: S41 family peptidase [Chitinophagales bacterium]